MFEATERVNESKRASKPVRERDRADAIPYLFICAFAGPTVFIFLQEKPKDAYLSEWDRMNC